MSVAVKCERATTIPTYMIGLLESTSVIERIVPADQILPHLHTCGHKEGETQLLIGDKRWRVQLGGNGAVSSYYSLKTAADNAISGLDEDASQDFLRHLVCLLKAEPFLSHQEHPSDAFLAGWLTANSSDAGRWLSDYVRDEASAQPKTVETLLRCMGRQPRRLVTPWGYDLAYKCLVSNSVEVRDAAVSVLENWGGKYAGILLGRYLPQERDSWLAGYIRDVLSDLSE